MNALKTVWLDVPHQCQQKRYFRSTFRTCTAFADLGCDGGGPPPLPLFLLAASGVLVGTSWKRLSGRKERKIFFVF